MPHRGGLAYPLLVISAFLWACNAAVGRWAVGEVSPQVITTLRWCFVCLVLAGLAWRDIAAERVTLRRHWRRIMLMGAGGFTGFASLFYTAGTYTTAINLALFQGAIPVMVIGLSYLIHRETVGRAQMMGVAITVIGAAIAATHGDWSVLRDLDFNRGDMLVLLGCLAYAGYAVALRSRPKLSALTFFSAMAAAAFVSSLPLLAVEWASGHTVWPTAKGWAIVAFVALGPSLAAQLAFIRGVESIGPSRAGLFVNLVPIFGAGLAVLLVGEPFGSNEALALALVLGGIFCAERFGRKPVAAVEPAAPPRASDR